MNYHNPPVASGIDFSEGAPPSAEEQRDYGNDFPITRTTELATKAMSSKSVGRLLRDADGGDKVESLLRGHSEPPPNTSHLNFIENLSAPAVHAPIPLPRPDEEGRFEHNTLGSLLVNIGHSLNQRSINDSISLKRQQYSIAQNLVTAIQNDSTISNLEEEITTLQGKIELMSNAYDSGFASLNAKLDEVISRLPPLDKGKAKAPSSPFFSQTAPLFAPSQPPVPSPEVERLNTSITSLCAQVSSLQQSVSRSESQRATQVPSLPAAPRAPSARPSTPVARGPTPSPPKSNPWDSFDPLTNFSAGLHDGHAWFTDQLTSLPDESVHWWARVITMGQWGPIKSDTGKPAGIRYEAPANEKRFFIAHAIRRAFSQTGCRFFLVPPSAYVSHKPAESFQSYAWSTWNGHGVVPSVRAGTSVAIAYPPENRPHKVLSGFAPGVPVIAPPAAALHARVDDFPSLTQSSWPSQHASGSNAIPLPSALQETPTPWNKVAKGGKTISFAKAAANAADLQAPAPSKRFRHPATSNSHRWILRFPKDHKIPQHSRPPPLVIVDKINLACKETHHVKAVLADWIHPSGNLAVVFNPTSSDKNIGLAAATIIKLFCPDALNAVTFRKAVTWSKIVFPRVPCRSMNINKFDGNSMTTNETWSKPELLTAVKNSHPLLENAYFTELPDRTVENVPFDASVANLVFSIEDPDSSIADTLTRSEIILFATRIRPQGWKEKINLTQCSRCFKLGESHPACSIRCIKCGSSSHSVEAHNRNCPHCIGTGVPVEDLSSPDWICAHHRCLNCGGNHQADDPSCHGRNEAVRAARAKKPGMSGQTLLDARDIVRPGPSRGLRY